MAENVLNYGLGIKEDNNKPNKFYNTLLILLDLLDF